MNGIFAASLFAISLSASVAHADILIPGSTVSVGLRNVLSNGTQITRTDYTYTIGSGVQAFTFGSVNGTFDLTQSVMADGAPEITFTVVAGQDLFPGTDPNGYGSIGLGEYNPLDFTAPFDITSALLTYSGPQGTYGPTETVGYVTNQTDFDGSYPGPNMTVYFLESEGKGFDDITINLIGPTPPTSPTPEPSSLALLGTGFAGLIAAGRKHFRK